MPSVQSFIQDNFSSDSSIYAVAVIVSLLFSIIAIYFDVLINNDGMMYLRSASFFYTGEWANGIAADITQFPLYPLLIALISKLTSLPLEYAAHTINAIFDAACIVVFIRLAAEFSNGVTNRRLVMLAAVVTMLAFTQFNDYRTLLIRDHGFWFFNLLSLLMLLFYWRNQSYTNAMKWGGAALIAALFRIEGAIFLLLMPMVLLLQKNTMQQRIADYLKAYIILLPIALIVLSVVLYTIFMTDSGLNLANTKVGVERGMNYLSGSPIIQLNQKAEALSDALFTETYNARSGQYALLSVLAVLGVILVSKLFSVLSPVYAITAAYSVFKRSPQSKPELVVIYWACIINVLIVSLFLATQFFLSARYLIPLAMLILLLVPYGLLLLYKEWQLLINTSPRARWLFPAACLLLVAMAVDGLVSFGPSKRYIRDAADWLNTTQVLDAVLVSNYQQLLYYSRMQEKKLDKNFSLKSAEINSGNSSIYWAVKVSRKDSGYEKRILDMEGVEPSKQFANSRNDRVLIYILR